jgi:hypothetical protein
VSALALLACSDESETADGGTRDGGADQQARPDLAAPHSVKLFDRVRIHSKGTVNVRKAEADLSFDRGPYSKVTLKVELDTSCYPFSKWATNPPPAGENWPADCDAFDRNFEFHMDPPKTSGDKPAIEWVRAITPFGGPMKYDVDLTDVANGLPGKHTVRVKITTYSDSKGIVSGSNGGWWVTATLDLVPGTPPRKVLAVIPLVNHSFKKGTAKQEVSFTVPAGTKSSRLEYRVTGHGGGAVERPACIGPAEEFCQRWQYIYVDDQQKEKRVFWRSDCDKLCTLTTDPGTTRQYCKENPCGAIQSVRAPRANWCPGSVTPPFTKDYPELRSAGSHKFGYFIESVADKGSWVVSAVYFAFGG